MGPIAVSLIAKLINQFGARETAPIQVVEVLDILKAWGIKDEVYFWGADIDTDVLKGLITHWDAPWDDGTTKRFADIYVAKSLPNQERRLVECKELLHILDPDWALVSKRSDIETLIEKIVIPPDLQDPFGDGEHANSDRIAMLHAVAVLFPWATRALLLPVVDKIGIQRIADEIVDLPARYVATVMSDQWAEVFRIMTTEIVPVRDKDGNIQLHDMYVGGQWLGSQRTREQCDKFLEQYIP